MRFSIIMPTMGKRPEFLKRAVESVLSQDFGDFELIVKDGGKADMGGLLPEDPRLKYVRMDDTGIGQALNQGCAMATGEILNESNDDDLMAPGALAFVDGFIGDAEWMYGQIKYGDETTCQPWDYERLKRVNFVPQPAVFFRKRAWEAVGGFDEVNNLAADYDMWLKLGARHEPRYAPKVLAFYTLHEGQLTNTNSIEQRAHANNVAAKYL